jgi:two-component system cell cycle sensor histidine kinase/response regulator CckA
MESATLRTDRQPLFDDSMRQLLQLAIAVCGVRSAVIRVEAHAPVVSGDPIPLDVEEALARWSASDPDALVIPGEAGLERCAPGINFYAAVKLFDSAGALRGTLALADGRARTLSESQKESLLIIAAQAGRDIEASETIRTLRELQAPWWPLIDAAPVAIFCFHVASGRLSYVNRKLAESLGYTAREVLELDSVTDIITDDQREVVKEMIRRREAGDDREVCYVTKVRCRDGTVMEAEVHSTIADAGAGRIVIGAAVDITTEMASRRRLIEREEYFRALTEYLSDAIAIVNRDHVLTYISPSSERVLGYAAEELVGKVTWAAIHPDDAPAFAAALSKLAAGGPFECTETRIQHKHGNWRTFEVEATNLLDHPQIRGLVLNLRDVTDRKRMERELEQLNRLTSLGRLAAQVAHEFNNVMMGIQPMVEAIRRRAAKDEAVLRFTDVISASIQRGKRITTDILRFSRPAQLAVRAVNIHDLVQQAASEIRPLLGEQVKLELSLPEPRLNVCADPAQLTQALINLALNARDAIDGGGGVVTLEIEPAGAFVHIAVSDTGSGIAANDLPYIFEPLYTTKPRGTGLGLSVVFQIVAAHRGRISVDSEPGKGTTFHLFIPAVSGQCEGDDAGAETASQSRQQSLRVLIVDDEEPIATGLRLSLEAVGMNVHTVGTGAEVLPAIDAFAPDVVVLDLSLPDEDGRAVYERIAKKSPVPVIFSSGHASESEIAKLLAPSRTAVLIKPYATEELLDAIHGLLGEEKRR